MYKCLKNPIKIKSRAGANSVAQKKRSHSSDYSIVDNRCRLPVQRRALVLQRYGWGVLDSQSKDDPEIVRGNITRAGARYDSGYNIETDPEKEKNENITKRTLGEKEPLHIHGHGDFQSIGGFSARSLATEIKRRFTNLKGKVILLHSCEVGSANYLKELITELAGGNRNLGSLEGTAVIGPERFLVVNEDGLSQVAKPGVKEKDLDTFKKQKSRVEKKGIGWKGVKIVNSKVEELKSDAVTRIVNTNIYK